MNGIRIRETEEMNIRNAYVIDGFPSLGLVGSIVASHLVNHFHLRQIAVIDSEYFPVMSLIKNGIPCSPVRIHAGATGENRDEKLVIFVSEFEPPHHVIKSLAVEIMDWVEDHKCRMVISPEGLKSARKKEETNGEEADETIVYGIASTEEARAFLEKNGIRFFQNGVVHGMAGVLLNEGVTRGFDVISLLARTYADYPDARAAATAMRALDQLILRDHLDVEPLLKEAEIIEAALSDVYRKAGKEEDLKKIRSVMYG
jgi:uncharacterized protein